jgi:predicted AAA+ superfamily ATPase
MSDARLVRTATAVLRGLQRSLPAIESLIAELAGTLPAAGLFERHTAFLWHRGRGPGRLVPVAEPALFRLEDLVGVDRAKQRLTDNTEQFVRRLPSNHVLLFGERGTGKSSAVRGLLDRFADDGLRIVEVQKSDLVDLPRILEALRVASAIHRFLIFCDDLAFGPGEVGFRELKAVLEGSIAQPPDNVRFIATSNRRHLVPESMADNRAARLDERGELHLGEALEEKLALSDRFGLTLGFYTFDQDTYLQIVDRYLDIDGVGLTLEDVRSDALRWALDRDSRSGRTARQFVTDLAGRRALERGDRRGHAADS